MEIIPLTSARNIDVFWSVSAGQAAERYFDQSEQFQVQYYGKLIPS